VTDARLCRPQSNQQYNIRYKIIRKYCNVSTHRITMHANNRISCQSWRLHESKCILKTAKQSCKSSTFTTASALTKTGKGEGDSIEINLPVGCKKHIFLAGIKHNVNRCRYVFILYPLTYFFFAGMLAAFSPSSNSLAKRSCFRFIRSWIKFV